MQNPIVPMPMTGAIATQVSYTLLGRDSDTGMGLAYLEVRSDYMWSSNKWKVCSLRLLTLSQTQKATNSSPMTQIPPYSGKNSLWTNLRKPITASKLGSLLNRPSYMGMEY